MLRLFLSLILAVSFFGPTIGEILVQKGHKLRRADKNRAAGKVLIHEHLRARPENGRPKLQIFNSLLLN